MDLGHAVIEIIGTAATTTTTLGLYMWNNKKQAKEDARKRHEENQALLNGLVTERKYFPAHKHKENKGPLMAECIEFPPENGGIKP